MYFSGIVCLTKAVEAGRVLVQYHTLCLEASFWVWAIGLTLEICGCPCVSMTACLLSICQRFPTCMARDLLGDHLDPQGSLADSR